MEIDFLGLNSHKNESKQENLKNSFAETGGGVEISLSLSSTSSFNFSDLKKKKKKKWEFADCDKTTVSPSCSGSTVCSLTKQPGLFLVAPPAFRRPGGGGGFPYDLNDAATPDIRNMSAENSIYVVGNPSNGRSGHVPTVAMARRATLARFLEKRLHRMNQGRASQLFMGKSSLSGTSSEVCDTSIPRNNTTKKKCNNSLKRR